MQIGDYKTKATSYVLNVTRSGVITTSGVGDSINSASELYNQNGHPFIAKDSGISSDTSLPPYYCTDKYASG